MRYAIVVEKTENWSYPNCGHLACIDCGYCSRDCDLVAQRQYDVSARQRLSYKDGYFA